MKNSKQELINLWLWVNKINKNNHEKGNTLIIAMGIGLVLVIATSMALFNSSKDKTNTISGESEKKTIAVAELGVTRVHDFLAKNSTLAEYPLNMWETQAGTTQVQGTFPNTSTSNSTCSTLTSGAGTTTTIVTTVGQFQTSGQTVVLNPTIPDHFRQGAFKVIDYKLVDSSLNPLPPNTRLQPPASTGVNDIYGYGILTVQGQINPNANSASDLFPTNNPLSSVSKVEVTIPLKKATISVPFPGVWISNQEIGSPSNSIIDATLLVPDCDNMQLQIAPGNNVILSSMTFPTLPSPPSDTDPKYYNLGNVTTSMTLPRSGDLPIATEKITHNGTEYNVQVYKYKVNNLSLNGGEKITIVPGRKVIIHLYGNLDIGGSQVINNSCTTVSGQYTCNTTTKVVTYPTGDPSVFKRENLTILGYGTNPTPTNPANPEPHICLEGGAEVFGFVFAPDYAVGAAGTGGGNGFTGAVWARMFNPPSTCGSNTGQIVVVQDIDSWDFLENLGLTVGNVPPQLGSISKWRRIGG